MNKRVLLVANPRMEAARALVHQARAVVAAQGWEAVESPDAETPLPAGGASLAVVFGGDGTVLATLHRMMEAARPAPDAPAATECLPPILGVNMGQLGFLADVAPDEMERCLPMALEQRLLASPRLLAEVGVRSGGRVAWRGLAANEALVSSACPGRAARLEAWVDGEKVMAFAGDGLLAATPTGSTAHALSAGGPVMSESVRALVLAPVCPHRLSLRPLVVGPDETVTVRVGGGGRQPDSEAACWLWMDGWISRPLAPGDEVTARVASGGWTLVRKSRTGYPALRSKMGWDGGCVP